MNKTVKHILLTSSVLLMIVGIGVASNVSVSAHHIVRTDRINHKIHRYTKHSKHVKKSSRFNKLMKHHNYVPKKKQIIHKLANDADNNSEQTNQNNLNNNVTNIKHHRRHHHAKGAWDIVNYAKSQIGKHHYSEIMGISRHSRNGMMYHPKNGSADCASFAYFVYRHCGYKVPEFDGNAWSKIGTVYGPKRVRASQTMPGSIVQNPIHMVILEEKYHGPKTKVIEEGGYWNGGNRYRRNVNEGRLSGAFAPADGHYLFFNPVKATK